MDKRTSSHEYKHAGAFKRLTTTLKNPEPTVRRTMCDGRSMQAEGEENTSSNVRRVDTSVRKTSRMSTRAFLSTSHVRRLCCLNICAPCEDGVDDLPRERLLVGDSPRQRLQGRPFLGRGLLLLARPSARSRPSVKLPTQTGVFSTRQAYTYQHVAGYNVPSNMAISTVEL